MVEKRTMHKLDLVNCCLIFKKKIACALGGFYQVIPYKENYFFIIILHLITTSKLLTKHPSYENLTISNGKKSNNA